MNIPDKPLLSRKDISKLLVDVSPRQIASNEHALGLDKAKVMLNQRRIFYRTCAVIIILKQRGLIE